MNKFLSVSFSISSLKEFILFFYPFRNNFTISYFPVKTYKIFNYKSDSKGFVIIDMKNNISYIEILIIEIDCMCVK